MNERIQQELELIKKSVLDAVPAEAIYLFGSHAYGTPREDSDLDIYVVVPDDSAELSDIRASIRKNARYRQKMPMDLLVVRSSVFNRRKNGPTIEKTIAERGVTIHG